MPQSLNLPETIKHAVSRLATPFPDESIPSLRVALKDYGISIGKAAKTASFMDVPLALELCGIADGILERYPGLDADSRKIGAAAVKYFLMRDDAINGFTTPGGFEDDALVLREAMRRLGESGSAPEWPFARALSLPTSPG